MIKQYHDCLTIIVLTACDSVLMCILACMMVTTCTSHSSGQQRLNVTVMELSQELWKSVADSRFNMNCTNFSLEEFKFINRCRSITGTICMMILLAVLLFLICSKAYSTVFQRLYMCLVFGHVLSGTVLHF